MIIPFFLIILSMIVIFITAPLLYPESFLKEEIKDRIDKLSSEMSILQNAHR